ncbi:hypothetical protein, partial [Streptomyces sp. ST2-7A]|uniref:hypothetical protein n=1 Tax=Streptomyces sp. ST2-7A TaxID=2907214 RepID=UPI001F3F57E2
MDTAARWFGLYGDTSGTVGGPADLAADTSTDPADPAAPGNGSARPRRPSVRRCAYWSPAVPDSSVPMSSTP